MADTPAPLFRHLSELSIGGLGRKRRGGTRWDGQTDAKLAHEGKKLEDDEGVGRSTCEK